MDAEGWIRLRGEGSRRLTPREVEVVKLFADGLSYGGIARRLGVSENTVKNHATSIRQKLGAADKLGATVMAWRLGYIN